MLLPTANACNVQGVSKERKNLLLLYKREEILHCIPLDIFPNDRNFKYLNRYDSPHKALPDPVSPPHPMP